MHHTGTFLTFTLVNCLVLLVGFPALANTAAQASEPVLSPTLGVSQVEGTIEVDGDLSDSGWRNAARATGFVEVNPGDNAPPAVESAAMMTYDESNLYIAFIAWDDPRQVRASMSDRDAIFRDDYFGVMLDTYADYAWGYEIFVNPLGMQGDLRLTSDGNEDPTLDLVFESEGIVTDSGYQVELAIPFASLRFPDKPEQTWRLNFWRDRQRENRNQYSWAAQDRDNACWVCQWGTLTGIKDVKPSSNLDILPNVVSYQSGAMSSSSVPDSPFDSQNPDAEFSINARYGLSTNSSVELTINPDFSQVESDAGQIDVNETFALYYSERRPFFQEGADLYRSFLRVIHTRTVNDPILAGKFTGQFGRYSLAFLTARDEHTPLIVPLRERSYTLGLEASTVNILRARRTLGRDSYVGLVVTDRRTDGDRRVDTLYDEIDDTLFERRIDTIDYTSGSGTAYGIDGRLRVSRNLSVSVMGLGSHTSEPNTPDSLDHLLGTDTTFDYDSKTVELDGESFSGFALYTQLNWGSRYWDWTLSYEEESPTFRADNGWITANDRRQLNFWTGLTFHPNRPWLVTWGPRMQLGRVYNHRAPVNIDPGTFDPGTRDEWWRPGIYLNLKGQTDLTLEYMASREWYRGQLYTGISRVFLNLNTRPSGAVELSGYYEYGHKVVRFLPRKGLLTNLSLYASLKPTQRLRIDQEFDYQRMNNRDNYMEAHPHEDRTIYSVAIYRTRISYQFTREWFLRLIIEYGDNDNVLQPNYLSVEPLLTYRINPFTLFYIGASWGGRHFKEGYVFTRETQLSDGTISTRETDWNNATWRLERAQVFAKFQYLFRL
jgi:hypothetical protein